MLVRNLLYFLPMNLAVALGVAVGTATLTGALLVGDSMRGSLAQAVLGRLGRVDHAVIAQRFFREALAADLSQESGFPEWFEPAVPALILQGSAGHAETRTYVRRLQVLGVDERYWAEAVNPLNLREVILNEPAALELGAKPGDDVLIRIGAATKVSPETLLGRRDANVVTLRLTVAHVLPAEGLAGLGLGAGADTPRNAFIPLATLQRALQRPAQINVMLVTSKNRAESGEVESERLSRLLRSVTQLADFELKLRQDPELRYVALESDRFLLEPAAERAARAVAQECHLPPMSVLTYLANEIRAEPPSESPIGREGRPRTSIPYSTVSAIENPPSAGPPMVLTDGTAVRSPDRGTILLNEWAATELGIAPGQDITLSYYVTRDFGRLETQQSRFRVGGVIRLDGIAADRGLTPAFPGVTDSDTISAWDPPFPVDLSKVRDADEGYWKRHRATPKALISLEDGQSIWASDGDRLGRLTSLRWSPADGEIPVTAARFESELRSRLEPAEFGLHFEPLRRNALRAAQGNTDFGMLFIGFSSFLILSAAMLVGLLFRLHVERRAKELGLLSALGFTSRTVLITLLAEGAIIVLAGASVGIAGAGGYAWLMLAGLRSWWSAAVQAPFLGLHVSNSTLLVGFLAGWFMALLSITWAAVGLMRRSTWTLISGIGAPLRRPGTDGGSRARSEGPMRTLRMGVNPWVTFVALAMGCVALMVPAWSRAAPQSLCFFLSGVGFLGFALAVFNARLQRQSRGIQCQEGLYGALRLGTRNAGRYPGRSLLTVALMASATFLITALEAFRRDPDSIGFARTGGTGGYSIAAESAVPLNFELTGPEGRERLAGDASELLNPDDLEIAPFRLQAGDETSCLNLYRPKRPRVLGAGEAMIQRGGFAFAATEAQSPEDRNNPWLLLQQSRPDGTIPVIGDESAVRWQLHSGLGQEWVIEDGHGRSARLRFVALLQGSVLQSELIVSEANFKKLFPSSTGYSFFLIATPSALRREWSDHLERALSEFGFDATSAPDRLAAYLAVQNTYLSTFQTLGGLGLVLGGFGLVTVMIRNVWERRGELALLRVLGLSRTAIQCVVLAENVLLVLSGVLCGLAPALVSVAPYLLQRPGDLPWGGLALTLAGVLATGLGAGSLALIISLRAPLLPALRAE